MATFVALFRGINVGGKNVILMKDFAETMAGLGLRKVETYIQSGNVVLQAEPGSLAVLAKEIGAAVLKKHGFAPQVVVLSISNYRAAVITNPFPEGESEPKFLHLYFCRVLPKNRTCRGWRPGSLQVNDSC